MRDIVDIWILLSLIESRETSASCRRLTRLTSFVVGARGIRSYRNLRVRAQPAIVLGGLHPSLTATVGLGAQAAALGIAVGDIFRWTSSMRSAALARLPHRDNDRLHHRAVSRTEASIAHSVRSGSS